MNLLQLRLDESLDLFVGNARTNQSRCPFEFQHRFHELAKLFLRHSKMVAQPRRFFDCDCLSEFIDCIFPTPFFFGDRRDIKVVSGDCDLLGRRCRWIPSYGDSGNEASEHHDSSNDQAAAFG